MKLHTKEENTRALLFCVGARGRYSTPLCVRKVMESFILNHLIETIKNNYLRTVSAFNNKMKKMGQDLIQGQNLLYRA